MQQLLSLSDIVTVSVLGVGRLHLDGMVHLEGRDIFGGRKPQEKRTQFKTMFTYLTKDLCMCLMMFYRTGWRTGTAAICVDK